MPEVLTTVLIQISINMVYDYTDLLARVTEVVYLNTSKGIKAEKLKVLLQDMADSSVNLKYDPDRAYKPGGFCVYDSGGGYKAYACISPTTGAFSSGAWSQIGV